LLFLGLGACPHDATSGQLRRKVEPPLTPVLPAEQAWIVSLPQPPSAVGAMDDTRVYIPLEGERLIALSRETGATAWTVDIESAWPPVVRDGVVYLAASDELHALDAATGEHKWRVPLGRGPMAPMALVKDVLVALVTPDEVWAFRSSDGVRLWGQSLGGSVGPASMAVGANGIYIAIGDRLVRVMLADGAVRWDKTLPGSLRSPALARDRVFVGSTTNDFYAFEPDKGALVWRWRFGGDVMGAAANESLVVVASLDNIVRGLRRSNGNQAWKQAMTTRPAESPQIVDGVVVVASLASLVSFNAETGEPIGSFDGPFELQGTPLIDPAPKPFAVSLVALTSDGRAIGLRPTEMMFRERALEPLGVLPGRILQREPNPRNSPPPTPNARPR
jgi:outer membrane protein assembly factor BamB